MHVYVHIYIYISSAGSELRSVCKQQRAEHDSYMKPGIHTRRVLAEEARLVASPQGQFRSFDVRVHG